MQGVVSKVSCVLLRHLFKRHSVNSNYKSVTVLGARVRGIEPWTHQERTKEGRKKGREGGRK